MSKRIAGAVGMSALIVASAAYGQEVPSDIGRNWSAITACGAMRNAETRHSCVDEVMRRAGVLSDADIARNAREEFGRHPEVQKPAKVARPVAAPAKAPIEQIDQLVTTIKSVSTLGYRKLRVTTVDGSVWEQSQTADLFGEPAVGDGFAVEKAAMGSYLCRFGRSKSYRCRRVD